MKSSVKKIWNFVSGTLVALAVVLAFALVGVRLIGLDVYTVLSGSMEPEIHVGSIIYVKEVDYRELKVGDVLTFMLNENTVATHRITEVLVDEEDPTTIRFFTKGDANDAGDGSSVHYKNIIGSPVFSVPYLGYVADYIQNPPGTYITIAVGALLLIAVFIPDLFGEDEKEKKKKEEEAKKEEVAADKPAEK